MLKSADSKAPFTREPFQKRADRLCIYTGTNGTVPARTASCTRMGPPRRQVRHGTEPKSSLIGMENFDGQ